MSTWPVILTPSRSVILAGWILTARYCCPTQIVKFYNYSVLIGRFQFGMILKAYFKQEDLVSEVFSVYMRSNYFTRTGRDQSSFELNVQACRLVLDILPGLEVRPGELR